MYESGGIRQDALGQGEPEYPHYKNHYYSIMSTKHGGNFTNFQNISVRGSGTQDPQNTGHFEMFQGLTNNPSTVAIRMIGSGIAGSENSSNEHPYFSVSNAGLSLGTGWIRLTNAGASPYGTLSVSGFAGQGDRAWRLPGLNGIMGVFGTLEVGLEAITANYVYSTNVVLTSGAFPQHFRDMTCIFGVSRLTGTATTRGYPIYVGNTPGPAGVELFFSNPFGTGTVAQTMEMNYICAR